MRIASLVPATTEIVYALERGGDIVARTHECDHPPEVLSVQAVTRDVLPGGLSPAEIDAAVSGSLADRHTIYALDVDALRDAAPDVVLTQSTCAVCAVDRAEVEEACSIPGGATVFAYDPMTLDEIVAGVAAVGEAIDAAREGLRLAAHMRRRLDWLVGRLADRPRPRVAVVEWPDPVYAPGHWVPDMVRAAGAESVFGAAGDPSHRVSLADLADARPGVLVLAYCGFDLATTERHSLRLLESSRWSGVLGMVDSVIAVDGSAYFSRPGPRVVDGVELLAWALHSPHPDLAPEPGRGSQLVDGRFRDLADEPLHAVAANWVR